MQRRAEARPFAPIPSARYYRLLAYSRMMDISVTALERYLTTLVQQRAAGVPETSYYPALQTLLDEVGDGITPAVKAIVHLRNTGVGIPDMGLFDANTPVDQKPSRGVIEVKGVAADLLATANSEQVTRYCAHYGQVLVTNYYQFILVTRDEQGKPQLEERYNLAENAEAFWRASATPRAFANDHLTPLREYLLRVMRRSAPLASPQEVAWMLASYAREAKARITASGAAMDDLDRVQAQLQGALGVQFGVENDDNKERAEDFFRSTLVQTLFYGVFSAWVLWHERRPAPSARFDLWRDTRELSVPVIKEIFEELTKPSHLRPLALEEVLEWTTAALNRVDRAAFFERFAAGDAVQYFYEPFLQAFDPELRRQLGVWYTPREVVRYMVARVDAALRDELGIADGLADPNVYILDPCCGTGAFLVETLRAIHTRLVARDGATMAGQLTREAMQRRVFGFELLPAPFVVAHMQLGIALNTIGAPLDSRSRAGVYLTNALTGWERAEQLPLEFPELRREREAAETVKQQRPILVVLGNPPYSGYAGVAVREERSLTDAYRTTNRAPAPQGQGLNDLYIRFFRMAERKIAEQTGQGIVCYISNYSWLDGLFHPGMRERYLDVFDNIYIDNLHGDRIISEYAPDGRTSETVFAMQGQSSGIKVGTAIATLIRKPNHAVGTTYRSSATPIVPSASAPTLPIDSSAPVETGYAPSAATLRATLRYRDVDHARAEERRAALLESATVRDMDSLYTTITPLRELGYPFMPRLVNPAYLTWHKLPELFPVSFPGVKTSRDDVVVDIDRERLIARMERYFDPSVSHAEIRRDIPGVMENSARFQAEQVRDTLLKRGFLPQNIVRFAYRPFDTRWLYWEPETKLLHEKRPDYFPHVQARNSWIEARQRHTMDTFDRGMFTQHLADNLGNGLSNYFPLFLYDPPKPTSDLPQQTDMFAQRSAAERYMDGRKFNVSAAAAAYLEGLANDGGRTAGAADLFFHTLAILHAPAYRAENAGALRQDFPRIPLPKTVDALRASGHLGRRVAELLDAEDGIELVTQGDIPPKLAQIAVVKTVEGVHQPDFALRAGWGHYGVGSAVMPGRGRVVESTNGARTTYRSSLQMDGEGAGELLYDVYLNNTTYWSSIPKAVWEYTLGGYQVLKKWLSYREYDILKRELTTDEVRYFTATARRIAELLSISDWLNENYQKVIAQTWHPA